MCYFVTRPTNPAPQPSTTKKQASYHGEIKDPKERLNKGLNHCFQVHPEGLRRRCLVCMMQKKAGLLDRTPTMTNKFCIACNAHCCKEHQRDFHTCNDLTRKVRNDKGKTRDTYVKRKRK